MYKELEISANDLCAKIEDYPENTEILIGNTWQVIGGIGYSTIIDGRYTNDGNTVYLYASVDGALPQYLNEIPRYSNVTIRYEDYSDYQHPLYTAPKGLQQLTSCPHCGSSSYLRYESQELKLIASVLIIENSYYCDNLDCGDFYYQTIKVELGNVLSNTVEGEATVSDDIDADQTKGVLPTPYDEIDKD